MTPARPISPMKTIRAVGSVVDQSTRTAGTSAAAMTWRWRRGRSEEATEPRQRLASKAIVAATAWTVMRMVLSTGSPQTSDAVHARPSTVGCQEGARGSREARRGIRRVPLAVDAELQRRQARRVDPVGRRQPFAAGEVPLEPLGMHGAAVLDDLRQPARGQVPGERDRQQQRDAHLVLAGLARATRRRPRGRAGVTS